MLVAVLAGGAVGAEAGVDELHPIVIACLGGELVGVRVVIDMELPEIVGRAVAAVARVAGHAHDHGGVRDGKGIAQGGLVDDLQLLVFSPPGFHSPGTRAVISSL